MIPGLMMPPGLIAGGGALALTFKGSSTVSTQTATIPFPSGIVPGDLLVLIDMPRNLNSWPGANSGWTLLRHRKVSWGDGDHDMDLSIQYRIATGSEGSNFVTNTMPTTTNGNGKILLAFGAGASTAHHDSSGRDSTDNVALTIPAGSAAAPLVVVAGRYGASTANATMSPGADGTVQAGSNNARAFWQIRNSAPTNVTVTPTGTGSGRVTVGGYIRIA